MQTVRQTETHAWSWYCTNDPNQDYDPADFTDCETCDHIVTALDDDEGRSSTYTVMIHGEVDDRFHFCPTCTRENSLYRY